jgi:hypothetical protein
MMREQREDGIARYAAGADEVAASLAGFPAERWTVRPFPGKWTAAEIVHHLADSESTAALRLRRLVAEDLPVIHGYDQERFAVRLRYNDRPIGPALDAFRAARSTSVPILQSLTDDEWLREGWHSEMGRYTPERWLAIYSVHAHDHAQQIARLRDALRA